MKITTRMFFLCAPVVGVLLAASSHTVTLADTVSAAGTQLSAGDYKVEMAGDKAVFKKGKKTFEVPATLETGDQKYTSTSAIISDSRLREIDLGGTKNKIVFSPGSSKN